jgi:hypothetical protein
MAKLHAGDQNPDKRSMLEAEYVPAGALAAREAAPSAATSANGGGR